MLYSKLKRLAAMYVAVAGLGGALFPIVTIAGMSHLNLAAQEARAEQPKSPPAGAPSAAASAETKPGGFPAPAFAKAFVQRQGDSSLKMRAELPLGRFMTLIDADGKQVHVGEFVFHQAPAFTVQLDEVRVFDTRGRKRSVQDWAKGLKEETLVMLEFRDGDIDPKEFAHTFRLFRDDLTVLVVPTSVTDRVDKSRAFGPAKSLPQSFPGAPGPGGPIPPAQNK
jgi:hypothetical protein